MSFYHHRHSLQWPVAGEILVGSLMYALFAGGQILAAAGAMYVYEIQ
jgi:hypothetical protein